MASARKVKIRPLRHFDDSIGGPDSASYKSSVEDLKFRWSVVCQACYSALDSYDGAAEIGGRTLNIAGASRGDKAATVDRAKYLAFRRREAARLGIDLVED